MKGNLMPIVYLNVANKFIKYLEPYEKFISNFASLHSRNVKDKRTGERKNIYEIFNKEALGFIDYFISKNFLKEIDSYVLHGKWFSYSSARLQKEAAQSIQDLYIKYGKVIQLNYGYRPVGVSCGDDIGGKKDATDIYGHWTGFSIDIMEDPKAHDALVEFGWYRPYAEENWHYQFRQ